MVIRSFSQTRPCLKEQISTAEKTLDVAHVANETLIQLAGPGPGAALMSLAPGLFAAASGGVAAASFRMAVAHTGVERIGLTALGFESAFNCAGLLVAGPAGAALFRAATPFSLIHGGADLMLGYQSVRRGLSEDRPVLVALGLGEGLMGVGILGATLSATPLRWQGLVVAGLVGKMAAIALDHRFSHQKVT